MYNADEISLGQALESYSAGRNPQFQFKLFIKNVDSSLASAKEFERPRLCITGELYRRREAAD